MAKSTKTPVEAPILVEEAPILDTETPEPVRVPTDVEIASWLKSANTAPLTALAMTLSRQRAFIVGLLLELRDIDEESFEHSEISIPTGLSYFIKELRELNSAVQKTGFDAF